MPTHISLDPLKLLEVAVASARAGGEVLRARRSLKREIEFKGAIDLVTDADRASEAAVISEIHRVHPEHAILAEESGASGRPSSYRWIIDPLDGTTNYAHALPHYCVSVAVEGPAGVEAGVVYDPIRDELFAARRGGGATLNGSPIHVSETAKLGDALLGTGFPADLWQRPEVPLGLFNRFSRQARGMRRLGAAALDLAYVAAGRLDAFYEPRLKAWDLAAGALLVTEAGGTATHILGGALDLGRPDILGSNGRLHAALLEVITEEVPAGTAAV